MTRFSVPVFTEAPEAIQAKLVSASIEWIGPTYSERTGSGGPQLTGDRVIAVLHAEGPDAAEARVREAVGDDGDVRPAEVLGPDDH